MVQQCSYCNCTRMTRYWLRDVGLFTRCDECSREYFDDGALVTSRFDLHMKIKSLEDDAKHKDMQIALMKFRLDTLSMIVKTMQNKLDEVYFAPNMPGYELTKMRFLQYRTEDCNNCID